MNNVPHVTCRVVPSSHCTAPSGPCELDTQPDNPKHRRGHFSIKLLSIPSLQVETEDLVPCGLY